MECFYDVSSDCKKLPYKTIVSDTYIIVQLSPSEALS